MYFSNNKQAKKVPHAEGRRSKAQNGNVDALVGLNDDIFQNHAMCLRYAVWEEGHHLVAMLRLTLIRGKLDQKRVGDFATR